MKSVVGGDPGLVINEDFKPQYLAPKNRTPAILDRLDNMGASPGEDASAKQKMALAIRRDAFDNLANVASAAFARFVGRDVEEDRRTGTQGLLFDQCFLSGQRSLAVRGLSFALPSECR